MAAELEEGPRVRSPKAGESNFKTLMPAVGDLDVEKCAAVTKAAGPRRMCGCKAQICTVFVVLGSLTAIAVCAITAFMGAHSQRPPRDVVVRLSGHQVQDEDANALFNGMKDGERNFTMRIVDDNSGEEKGSFGLHVEDFNPAVLESDSEGNASHVVLINPESGGLTYGNTTITALVCESYHHTMESNCTLETSVPRTLMDDNTADVIKHGITYITVATVAIVCIAACTAAMVAAVPSIVGCFPARATVRALGGVQAMKSLSVGTLLLTSQGYSPMFLDGHHNALAMTSMLRLETASNHSITLTPDHYLPLGGGGHSSAVRVSLGNELLVQQGDELVPSPVTSKTWVTEQGLYNPYTTVGDLIVDGVLASCHSSWFLEGLLRDSLTVKTYNVLLAPLGLLYPMLPGWFERFAAQFAEDRRPLGADGALATALAALRALPGR